MSNEIQEIQTDLSPKDLEEIKKFEEAGRPGIHAAKPEVVKYALQLYIENNNLNYICQKTGLSRTIMLYLAHKHNWYQVKKDTYDNLATTLTTRLETAKLQGLDYLTEMAGASRQYFQEKIDLFKKTGDSTVLESLDPNVVKMYQKTLELLFKLGEDENGASRGKSPLVGINISEGATIQQNNDNTVTVTPNGTSNSQATALSTLAALNRLREEIEEQNKKKER